MQPYNQLELLRLSIIIDVLEEITKIHVNSYLNQEKMTAKDVFISIKNSLIDTYVSLIKEKLNKSVNFTDSSDLFLTIKEMKTIIKNLMQEGDTDEES